MLIEPISIVVHVQISVEGNMIGNQSILVDRVQQIGKLNVKMNDCYNSQFELTFHQCADVFSNQGYSPWINRTIFWFLESFEEKFHTLAELGQPIVIYLSSHPQSNSLRHSCTTMFTKRKF